MDEISALVHEYQKRFPQGVFRLNEPMSAHTTLKIGGPVSVMFLPQSVEEICYLAAECRKMGIRSMVLGNGSNLLFSDEPVHMAVIKTCDGLGSISILGDTVTAGAGALLSRIAHEAYKSCLTGLEFAHGIPGTLGGAVYMNAGAYGGEMKDVIERVTVLGEDMTVSTIPASDCGFSYRKSRFSSDGYVILSASIKLKQGEPEKIKALMDDLAARRREKQPLDLPSAGSTFKRPEKGYAAAMIEEAGLKGFSVGGAQVSEKHAGFVVNRGGATFGDFVSVMEHVQETVYKRTGVMLAPEVKIVR